MNQVATGIYLGVSVTDHSCKPNAVATFEGSTLYLRALEDMPKLDWSKIFISYIDVMNLPSDRRNELQSSYYFSCECVKCSDINEEKNMILGLCPNKDCGQELCLSLLKKNCDACGTIASDQYLTEFKEVIQFTKDHLMNMQDVACIYIYYILYIIYYTYKFLFTILIRFCF